MTKIDKKKLSQYSDAQTDEEILTDIFGHIQQRTSDGSETDKELSDFFIKLAAIYLVTAKGKNGKVRDPVGHFHLSNGARIERINWDADNSARGKEQSFGLMVNYLYNLRDIKDNSSSYESDKIVAQSQSVRSILRG